jgi:hypothetical protein
VSKLEVQQQQAVLVVADLKASIAALRAELRGDIKETHAKLDRLMEKLL